MQKIPFYLLPNRIILTTDRTASVMEFRKVYQRIIKLYKGIDNVIELEIKNNEQRRQDVFNRTVELHFYDQDHKKLFVATGSAKPGTLGIMTVSIREEDLANINPQMLKVAAKFSNEEMLYSDAQFDLFITAEVVDGFNETLEDVLETLTVFNYEFDSDGYVSEIGRFGLAQNDDNSSLPIRSIRVEIVTSDYVEPIRVQATSDKSTAIGTRWVDIGIIDPDDFNSNVIFSGDYLFIRFLFPKYRDQVTRKISAGTVDKIIIRN